MPMTSRAFTPAEPDEACLATVPAVRKALDALTEANTRWEAAKDRLYTARKAAESAPHADAKAALEAVAAGTKLPPVTAGKAEAQAEEAQRILDASVTLALQAEQALIDAVDTHRDELAAAQETKVENALDDVEHAVEALQAAMEKAGLELSRYVNIAHAEYSRPLTTPNPLRWEFYDSRADTTVDGTVSLDLIRQHAHDSRPSAIRNRELAAATEWQEVIEGRSDRYQPTRVHT